MPPCPAQTHPKRRRDAGTTRSAIFEAAIRRFADQGYQCAGDREIAADVGVVAAMVIARRTGLAILNQMLRS